MTLKPSGRLRAAKALGSDPEADAAGENGRIGGSFETLADLVADLIAPTEIIPRDRLAAARARAGAGSLAEALARRGTRAVGRHRPLARAAPRAAVHRPPGRSVPSRDAIELIPLRTLQRVIAIPVSLQNGRLLVAIADPANIHGIDELRLATQVPRSISASRAARTSSPSSRGSSAHREVSRPSRPSTSSRSSPTTRATTSRRRRRLRRAARPARQLDHHAGRDRRRQRHPLRAAGGLAARAHARRRRAHRGAADPEADGRTASRRA